MTARPVTSYVIACNICADELPPQPGEEFTPRFASIPDAIAFLADELSGWTVLPDGYALCGKRDEDHEHVRENIPALMREPDRRAGPAVTAERIHQREHPIPAGTDNERG